MRRIVHGACEEENRILIIPSLCVRAEPLPPAQQLIIFASYCSSEMPSGEVASGFQTWGCLANSRGVQWTYFRKTEAK